jgi:hypothetical protein
VYWAAINYAGIGAAWAWFAINLVYFAVFPMLVHLRILGTFGGWFYVDVAMIYLVEAATAYSGTFFLLKVIDDQSWFWLFGLLAVGLVTILAGVMTLLMLRLTSFRIAFFKL